MSKLDVKPKQDLRVSVIVILVAALAYGSYAYFTLRAEKIRLEKELARTSAELQESRDENARLASELEAEQQRIQTLVGEVGQISSTVGTLEKLSKTDPELLQKYSKIYFLNENYAPAELAAIASDYLLNPNETEQIHGRVWPKLSALLEAAKRDGLDLKVVSAFRSFGEQSSLKASYKVTYGTGANRFSADQGYSEHQLGTTADFTTTEIGSALTGFEKTPEYEWLTRNAHRYGFTLSYPEGNNFYIFEPWHWRFVGVNLADYLFATKGYFYDLDQREIDKYLVNIFD